MTLQNATRDVHVQVKVSHNRNRNINSTVVMITLLLRICDPYHSQIVYNEN